MFFIGEEWLYYKIYCGIITSDAILTEVIKPITESLVNSKIIDKWFYIRYSDPHSHIRVRFHFISEKNISIVINKLKEALSIYIDADLIWRVITDTYQREVERYGINTIELSENLFYNDSNLAVGILYEIKGDNRERIRWAADMLSIDAFINDFNYSLKAKYKLLMYMKESFEKEFNADKNLKKQLSNKYRKEFSYINKFMTRPKNNSDFNKILKLINIRSLSNKYYIEELKFLQKSDKLERPLNELIWSYLHMLNNRIFISKQRIHELVVYFFLYQYYKSKLARSGVKIKELELSFNK